MLILWHEFLHKRICSADGSKSEEKKMKIDDFKNIDSIALQFSLMWTEIQLCLKPVYLVIYYIIGSGVSISIVWIHWLCYVGSSCQHALICKTDQNKYIVSYCVDSPSVIKQGIPFVMGYISSCICHRELPLHVYSLHGKAPCCF